MGRINLQVRRVVKQLAVREGVQKVASVPHPCKCYCTRILSVKVGLKQFLYLLYILRFLVRKEKALWRCMLPLKASSLQICDRLWNAAKKKRIYKVALTIPKRFSSDSQQESVNRSHSFHRHCCRSCKTTDLGASQLQI